MFVGGPDAGAAAAAFRAQGLDTTVCAAPAAEALRRADAAGTRYTLVHVGGDDGEPEGTYARAHHRVALGEAAALAAALKPRARPLVTCLAFGFQQGMPPQATWLVDVRFLDNPYWVPELRHLTGRDAAVAAHVLRQAPAGELLDRLEALVRWSLPLYQRDTVTLAFGCTGGRHRSVALAAEMARRLTRLDEVDVEFEARELG